jgi:hypothetical protein
MSSCCDEDDEAWIQDRITKTKAMIVALEDAQLGLASGAIQTYQLDTGQTRQLVTKTNMSVLQSTLQVLEQRLQYYQSQLCGAGVVYVRPGF